MKGKFVVIEGVNKSGKTTQSRLLEKFLMKQGFSVSYTKHPQHRDIGEVIRKKMILTSSKFSPQALALAFAADLKVNQEEIMEPVLEKYDYVLADRYYHSTFVYQTLAGCKLEWIKELYRYIIKPDLTFILDVSLKEFRKRHQNNEDIYENEEFQKKLRKAYLSLPKKLNEDFIIIDGAGSVEEVHKKIREIVVKL